MFILIGSRAADFHGLKLRADIARSDYDVIGLPEDYEKFKAVMLEGRITIESKTNHGKHTLVQPDGTRFEYDGRNLASNLKLMEIVRESMNVTAYPDKHMFVVPNYISYLLKRSHANYNFKYDKTIIDLIKLKQFEKKELTTKESELYQLRRQEAYRAYRHTKARINLDLPNEIFFGQSAHVRTLDHDALHRIFAFDEVPVFEMVKRDLSKALIDKDLFSKLELDGKLNLIREESMVIGTERFYIPSGEKMDPRLVYFNGLKKFLRDLCKGWCQDFALDHIDQLLDPKMDFLARYHAAKTDLEKLSASPGMA